MPNGHGGCSPSSCISLGAYVSRLPQADGTAMLIAVIGLKARPMSNRAALGNRLSLESLRVAMFQAPYPIEQLRGAS